MGITSARAETAAAPQKSVIVLASSSGIAVAQIIVEGLVAMGEDATLSAGGEAIALERAVGSDGQPRKTPPHSFIVVITPDAHEDTAWLIRVQALSDERTIPVRVGNVNAQFVPTAVRELNWIAWQQPGRENAALSQIYSALHSEMALYTLYRDLAAQTAAWQAAGLAKDLLIADSGRVKDAVRYLKEAATDPRARPSEAVLAYVTASARANKKYRRKRARRWLVRATAVVTVLALFTTTVLSLRAVVKSQHAESIASTPWLIPGRPDWTGLLAAAAVLQEGSSVAQIGREVLYSDLTKQWALGIVGGGTYPAAVSAARLVGDGSTALAIDGNDRLSLWDVRRNAAEWIRSMGNGDATAYATTPDGTLAALGVGKQLNVAHVSPWSVHRVTLPCKIDSLAIAPVAGTIVAACSSSDSFYAVRISDLHISGPIAKFSSLLQLTATADGHARALVRTDPRHLAIVDPVSGSVVATTSMPYSSFEVGTLGPDGVSAALTGTDRQILYARQGLRFTPTGQAVPDYVEVLALLPGGRLAFGGVQFGVQILDLASGLDLGTVCSTFPGISAVDSTADGGRLLCANGTVSDVWSISAIAPAAAPRSATSSSASTGRSTTTTDSAQCGLSVVGALDGSVTVTHSVGTTSRRARLQPDASAVTATAIGADCRSVLVGHVDGSVNEFDVGYSSVAIVARWTFPDHASISSVGWSVTPDLLSITTTAGYSWSPTSCDGCGSDYVLLNHVKARLWGCYLPNALVYISNAARAQLGVTVCGPAPTPEG